MILRTLCHLFTFRRQLGEFQVVHRKLIFLSKVGNSVFIRAQLLLILSFVDEDNLWLLLYDYFVLFNNLLWIYEEVIPGNCVNPGNLSMTCDVVLSVWKGNSELVWLSQSSDVFSVLLTFCRNWVCTLAFSIYFKGWLIILV